MGGGLGRWMGGWGGGGKSHTTHAKLGQFFKKNSDDSQGRGKGGGERERKREGGLSWKEWVRGGANSTGIASMLSEEES